MFRVLNRKTTRNPQNSVFIGRPSKWGNPFHIGRDGSREEVISKYETWLADQPHLLRDLDELRGKNLVCYCSPEACHGDVLLRLANMTRQERVNWYRAIKGLGAIYDHHS